MAHVTGNLISADWDVGEIVHRELVISWELTIYIYRSFESMMFLFPLVGYVIFWFPQGEATKTEYSFQLSGVKTSFDVNTPALTIFDAKCLWGIPIDLTWRSAIC